jgi:hypothetical protein
MAPQDASVSWQHLPLLLRGEAGPINRWIQENSAVRVTASLLVIFVGAGLFGAAMGSWRAPLQALYTGIKLPLVLLLTTLGTALLNGMLAPLLGLNIRFSQALLAVLMSFTIFALILGSFSPLLLFLLWNMPALTSADMQAAYRFLLLTEVAIIAFAGLAANLRLVQLLERLSGSGRVAKKTLVAWLSANLFLGSQLCWILRPFIGSPGLPVQFLREDALRGNFYESVWYSMTITFKKPRHTYD